MNLNPRQQTILKVLCAYLAICTLFPPYYHGHDGLGYRFLLSPPEDGRMDIVQILFQWIPAILIAGISMFLAGPLRMNSAPTEPTKPTLNMAQMETLWSQIHKIHSENETRQLEVTKLEKRVADTEKAIVVWREIVSKHFRMITDQEDLL